MKEDSDVLPYDTSAGTILSPPKATTIQVPEKNKEEKWDYFEITKMLPKTLFWTQNSFHSLALHSFLATPAVFILWEFAILFLCLKSSPSPCHWPFKDSSNVTYLYLSPATPGRIYYYLLWDFATVNTLISFLSFYQFLGRYYLEPLVREQRSGASPSKGHLKAFLRNQCHCYNCWPLLLTLVFSQ